MEQEHHYTASKLAKETCKQNFSTAIPRKGSMNSHTVKIWTSGIQDEEEHVTTTETPYKTLKLSLISMVHMLKKSVANPSWHVDSFALLLFTAHIKIVFNIFVSM